MPETELDVFSVPALQTRCKQRHHETVCRRTLSRADGFKACAPSWAVIPRNYRVEEALAAAESGDLSVMERLLAALAAPYDYDADHADYSAVPPKPDRPYRTYCGT